MSIQNAMFVCAQTEKSPIFRKEFIACDAVGAEIEIAGLGFFELYINEKKVSDDRFVPPFSDYGKRDLSTLYYPIHDTFSHRVYFMRYDLSSYIITG